MNSPAPSKTSQDNESSHALLAGLLGHLQATQNGDGGWAFHGSRREGDSSGYSRVEPTCWALLALGNSGEAAQHAARGLDYLKSQQLSDGSWPATAGMSSGGWVTSLAALTLAQFSGNGESVAGALQWLCDDYPRDSSRWQKFLKSFGSAKHESHNDEFRGWGWTPRTSSWVEPTSFALLAFTSAAEGSKFKFGISAELRKHIDDRRALAVGLLYDRMCAGGGWNCGNPRVYGVDGDSLVLPTCWALLALRDRPDHPKRALSLAWLQKSFGAIAGASSLAIAQITLESYGEAAPEAPRHLTDFSAADLAEQGTHVAAWAALALSLSRVWPPSLQHSAANGDQSKA